jgi:hypothetical protein
MQTKGILLKDFKVVRVVDAEKIGEGYKVLFDKDEVKEIILQK